MLSYSDRAKLCLHPLSKRLLNLLEEKQSNLCLSADVTSKSELLKLAEDLGEKICVLKTHIDIIEDFDQDLIISLQRIAEEKNFLLFEDRKFADIGNTVKHQYQNGIYHIADWAHITNAHTVPGPGVIEGLREVGKAKGRALLLLAEMSSKGNLAEGKYTEKTIEMAEEYQDFVIGFITQKKLIDNPVFINFSPGVNMADSGDSLGQNYNTPESVIIEKQSDIIIVGRGIYQAKNPLEEAEKYRQAGWQAYLDRLEM